MGNVTKWAYNQGGQMVSKTDAGGRQETYAYEPDTGRLLTVTDAIGNVTRYYRNLDDSVEHVGFTTQSPTAATSSIAYTYDANYPRVVTAGNAYGTYGYTYKAYSADFAGGAQNGVGQLQKVTNGALPDGGPVSGTITTAYDELGRRVGRQIHGAVNDATWSYDAAGRLSAWSNPLGTFTPTYVNAAYGSSRPAEIALPGGIITAYQWETNLGDFRLKEIKHLNGSVNVIEKFNYATNAAGEITEWTTQKGAAAGEKYALDYDAASQLKTGLQTNASTGVTLHQNYYDYDKAGNRTSAQLDNAVTKFTANALNQITGSAGGGTLRVKGTLNEAGKVTINGQAA